MVLALIIADIVMAACFVFRFSNLPPQIPLIYSKPWGEDQLVDTWLIFLLPLSLHLFFFLNIFLYNKLFFPDHLIRRITFVINLALTIAFTLIFLKIILSIS